MFNRLNKTNRFNKTEKTASASRRSLSGYSIENPMSQYTGAVLKCYRQHIQNIDMDCVTVTDTSIQYGFTQRRFFDVI